MASTLHTDAQQGRNGMADPVERVVEVGGAAAAGVGLLSWFEVHLPFLV